MTAKTIFFLMTGVAFAYGANQFDPALRFKTLESPHFSIHYHDGEENLALEAAKIAESVHSELTAFMRWTPREKTQIVLLDIYDEANGLTTPFPVNTIFAYATQPGTGFDRYEDWLRELITHEYTHVLQMDMVHGLPAVLRAVFGRWVLNNAVQPVWQIEGLAVFNETEFTTGGRARGAIYDAMLRTAVIDNKLYRIDQAGSYSTNSSWPGGTTPYLYGAMFDQYLAETYGRDKLVEFNQRYSAAIPFFQNATARAVFGKDYYQLWHDWYGYLKDKYYARGYKILENPVTRPRYLTKTGYRILAPAFSPDGKYIAFTESNNREYTALRLMETANTKSKAVLRVPVELGIAWLDKSQGFLYSQGNVQDNFYFHDDIFYYDLKTRHTKQLTFGLRAKDPAVSADGRKIVFVVNKLGQNDLVVMDPYTAKLIYITETKDHTQYGEPRFSPDGKLVAVSVWKPGGNQDICLVDLESRQFAPVTNDPMIDVSPAWSPDGKYLLFSSDRSGVYNIYAYSFDDGKTYQVTNVLGGAFYPAVSPDGKKLVYCELGSNGYNLAEIDFDPTSWRPAPVNERVIAEGTYPIPEFASSVHDYNPFPTLWPRMWLPMPVQDEDGYGPGFITYGSDVLGQHQYTILAGMGWKSHRPFFDITYVNNQLYPTVTVHVSNSSTEDTPHWKQVQQGDVDVSVPFISTKSSNSFSVGYHGERMSDRDGSDSKIQSGVGLGWQFNDARRYAHTVSTIEGGSVGVNVNIYNRVLGSDENSARLIVNGRKYFRLPIRSQVLAVRFGAGISSDTAGFNIGGSPSFQVLGIPFLRGFQDPITGGDEFYASLEYRFPLAWVERGPGTWPVFLTNTHGALFFDFGDAWNGKIPLFPDFKKSVGAELRSDIEIGYQIPLTLRLGAALPLQSTNGFQIFGGVSSPF